MTRIAMWGARTSGTARALTCAMLLVVAGCGSGGGGMKGQKTPPVTLSASPTSIALGQSTTLTWSSSSGTTCSASGAWSGSKSASGTEMVTPSASGSVVYTLSCGGSGYSNAGSASTTVTVTAPSAFSKTSLVADTAGTGALTTDANAVNAWGIAFGPTSPLWVANNHSETSTVYDGNGKRQPLASPLVVQLPQPSAGVDFDPTGIVFNGTSDFVVTAGGKSGPARFLFAGESGAIAGWTSAVDATSAVVVYVDAANAKYTGLAIGSNGAANFLYAADFVNGKVDVFDRTFARQPAASFAFTDPNLPANYAPFGIQALPTGAGGSTQVYVSYAERAPPDNVDELPGAGLGIVDVYDANGVLVKRLVSDGGRLNAPWGIALAPADFGTLGNAVLVGNFGDGLINGYDVTTGAYVGTVTDGSGNAFAVPGLWGIAFGNDSNNQPSRTLFYAAGTNDEADGEIGRIDVGAAPPVLNSPPVVTITAPTGTVSGTTTISATATSSTGIARIEFFAGGISLGTVTTPPYAVSWDTTTVADGAIDLTATATDTSGNVGSSPAVSVTVHNSVAPAVTFTQLQTDIFTPKCSGCHDGSNPPGGALPGSQDLRAGHAYASLVNVASLEQPALKRVLPGDPDNSYLVRKLEGTAGISGARMPFGGPYLDQATIDEVRAWIAAGAPNN